MDTLSRELYGNIDGLSKALFYALAVLALLAFARGVWVRARVWRFWRLSQGFSWKAGLRRIRDKALLQRKVRQGPRKWGAGLAHASLFFGFLLLFIGTCLVAVEEYSQVFTGRSGLEPVFHKGLYFVVYELILDLAGLALIAGCFYFLWRRSRRSSSIERTPADWLVVGSLLYLGLSGYVIEGCRIVLEETPQAWVSPVGYCLAVVLSGMGFTVESVAILHKANCWAHAVVALGFVAAIPYCRLFHILAGTLNIALRDVEMGRMDPVSLDELEEKGYVGIGGVADLTGGQWLALDACVSCGRCQDACPAHIAGKPLSPRDLVQDLRRFGLSASSSGSGEGPHLHGDVIGSETLWACTTCQACVESCPVEVAPLEFITGMRRYLVGEGQLRGPAGTALQKMQRTGNPWGLPAGERFDWASGLDVPTVSENPGFEVLYWVGCAASYDPRIRKVAQATVRLLQAARVNFAVLGPEERCSGDSARRLGDEFLFQELAEANVRTLNQQGVTRIITHCPHCLNSLKKDYADLDGHYTVQHHSEFLQGLLQKGTLVLENRTKAGSVTYHDPCYLARANGVVDAPREALLKTMVGGADSLLEMRRSGCSTGCCGAGGGRMWFDDAVGQRTGVDRVREVMASGAETVAVGCPFCLTMLKDGLAAADSSVQVKDVAELLAEALQGN